MPENAFFMYFCDIKLKSRAEGIDDSYLGLKPVYMHSKSNIFRIFKDQNPKNSKEKLEAIVEASAGILHAHITRTFKEARDLGLVLYRPIYF